MRARFLPSLLAIVLVATGALAPVGRAGAAETADQVSTVGVDHELVGALDRADLWTLWRAGGTLSDRAGVLAVERTPDHDEIRGQFLDLAAELATLRDVPGRLRSEINELDEALRLIEEVVRTLRQADLHQTPLTSIERARLQKQLLLASPPRPGARQLVDVRKAVIELRGAFAEQLVGSEDARPAAKSRDRIDWNDTLEGIERLRDGLGREGAVASIPTPRQLAVETELEHLAAELHRLRWSAPTAIGVPLVVVDGYIVGERHVPDGCRTVDWAMLAGIGRVESLHGSLDGATVDSAGNASPQILGPLLDGGATEREIEEARLAAEEAVRLAEEEAVRVKEEADRYWTELVWGEAAPTPSPVPEEEGDEGAGTDEDGDDTDGEGDEEEEEGNGFAVIEDTDGGTLDGNPRWDRAVGPMQFLPETWRLWSTDGDGDGDADPHNVYDATASAARYLCHLEARNGPFPELFILGYNDSEAYVARVLELAAGYRALDITD